MSEITAVHTIMTRGVETTDPGESVAHALERMLELGVRHLPVVDGGRLVGMLSDRDLLRTQLDLATDPQETPVHAVMTRDIITTRPTRPITEAARLMIDNKISGLPVIDAQNAVVGMVTTEDMLKLAVDFDYLITVASETSS